MINQRKQDERRSLEAAQLSLLNKTIETQRKTIEDQEGIINVQDESIIYLRERISELEMQICERIIMDDFDINVLKDAGLWDCYMGNPKSFEIVERIKALESLLAELSGEFISEVGNYWERSKSTVNYHTDLICRVNAILPKTEEVKDEN